MIETMGYFFWQWQGALLDGLAKNTRLDRNGWTALINAIYPAYSLAVLEGSKPFAINTDPSIRGVVVQKTGLSLQDVTVILAALEAGYRAGKIPPEIYDPKTAAELDKLEPKSLSLPERLLGKTAWIIGLIAAIVLIPRFISRK